ncbi:MAG: hypothetical protein ACKVOU_04685 [Cytophagales bacterium]
MKNMRISELEMYELLRSRMGETEAREFLAYIESKVERTLLEAKSVFASKEDIFKLELRIVQTIAESNQKIEQSRAELNQKIEQSRAELNQKIEQSRAETMLKISETNQKIEQSKNDILKWLIVLILSSSTAIIGIILGVMRMGGWVN